MNIRATSDLDPLDGLSIIDAEQALIRARSQAIEQGAIESTIRVCIDEYDYSIEFERPETDKEKKNRLERERRANERHKRKRMTKQEKEYDTYLKLKSKYEK